MKVNRFFAKKLHGYLDIDINFFNDITFLYGINGSGKTSVLKCINALLSASFKYLGDIEYEEIGVVIAHSDRTTTISSSSSVQGIELRIEGAGALIIPRFVPDPSVPYFRQEEARQDWLSTIASQNAGHGVMKLLDELPNPMFLGLERRATDGRPRLRPRASAGRDSAAGNMMASLSDASIYAADAFRAAYIKESDLKDKLRNNLILALFVAEDQFENIGKDAFDKNKLTLDKMRTDKDIMISALTNIGMPREDIRNTIESFYSNLSDLIKPKRKKASSSKLPPGRTDPDHDDILDNIRFSLNSYIFRRAIDLSSSVQNFLSEREKLYATIENYKSVINAFLEDSRKSIVIDVRGLRVSLPGSSEIDIGALSSGEQQLVVLLTHLFFNESIRRSNVLIIDEPEVSLHLRWQERFISALLSSVDDTQIILATHSPSIILDRTDKAIQLMPY
jgi:predicted ATP-dependent endonuclease of OLD family